MKVVWVVSGCSSGLGRTWMHAVIADRGEYVIGITRSESVAQELQHAYGGYFIPCVADVDDEQTVSNKLLGLCADMNLVPTRIVTAAAYAQFGTLEDLTNAQIRQQFKTNVEGTLNVIRPLIPILRASTHPSRILLVSSMSGVACWPLLGAYQISKYAIEAVSDTLRHELYDFNIQVGCIEPGPHQTGWATQYAQREALSDAYNKEALMQRCSCGYDVKDPKASLPFFWKMFDEDVMPARIATSLEFVDFAVSQQYEKINTWRKFCAK